jgi:acetyltransferase-like isoleucine patch superfamily enzyme
MKLRNSEILRRGIQMFVGLSIFNAPGLLFLRHACYRFFFNIGKNPILMEHVRFNRPHNLTNGFIKIGNNVGINSFVEIDYSGNVIIEDNVWISQRVIIETHSHQVKTKKLKKDHPIKTSQLILKNDCWLGANVFISENVDYIGQGAIVGAGSVVTKNIPNWAIATGIPANVIKYRK